MPPSPVSLRRHPTDLANESTLRRRSSNFPKAGGSFNHDYDMDLNPELPPLPTLTPLSTQLNPPEKPPDPSISLLFPESTQYRVPVNPFKGALPKMRNKEHREALKIALESIRAPFLFDTEKPLTFNGDCVDVDMTTETFNAAVTTVVAALERGYFSTCDPTPLGPTDWARLSCALLAAVGRGYHRQYSTEKESTLDRVRAEVIDPDPLPKNPTLFHHLAAIADDLNTHIGPDQDGYQDWYLTLKKDFDTKATKAAAAEVDEKWLRWKSEQLDMLIHQHENEIAAQARCHGIDYFIATGQRLGLDITRGPSAAITTPTPTTGKKRTVSGSRPRQSSATPVMRKAAPIVNQAAFFDTPDTPRGRPIALRRLPSDNEPHPDKQRGHPTHDEASTRPQGNRREYLGHDGTSPILHHR
ncbi:hypothetical protein BGW80DRAFT_1252048 [Lactifluus volemus]|nr:hypothetical protein BGW80DRAFT_1252048 [Lactifluus volemus]